MFKTFLFGITLTFIYTHFGYSQTVGVLQNDSLSLNGYTLFAPNVSKKTYLIDNCGHLINSWESEFRPNFSAYLLEDGCLLRTKNVPPITQNDFAKGGVEKFNWEGDLIWQYSFVNTIFAQHHDIEAMPNGNVLVIVYEQIPVQDLIENGRDPDTAFDALWSEKIIELEPIGSDSANIVWEWRAWDHLVQDFDSTKTNYGVVSEHPERFNLNFGFATSEDWMHFNAIDYNETLDQIALSSRNFEEIYIIDHSTTTLEAASSSGGNAGKGGGILYRWGNPFAYDRGIFEDKVFYGQHNVHWIAEGLIDEGKLMVFNNGPGRPEGNYSTIDVFEPPVDEQGNYIINAVEPFGPVALSWTYESSDGNGFYSSRISGAQRLENGNTLICEGNSSRLFEVTFDGEIVWEYQSPIGATGPIAQGEILGSSSIFRSLRYSPSYPAFENIELLVGEVLESDPWVSECQIFDGNIINDVISKEEMFEKFDVVPNPINDQFQLVRNNNTSVLIEVYNISGSKILSFQSNNPIDYVDASQWQSGCYFIQIFDLNGNPLHVAKLIR